MIAGHLKNRKGYSITKYARLEAQEKSNSEITLTPLVHNIDESGIGEVFHICSWWWWKCVCVGGDVAAAFAPSEPRADYCKRSLQHRASPCLLMNLAVSFLSGRHALIPKMQAQPFQTLVHKSYQPTTPYDQVFLSTAAKSRAGNEI